MSLPASSPSKKRKHRELAGNEPGSPHKKVRKDGKEKRSKGKSKTDGQFQVVNASVLVSIPPKFSSDPLSGAKEMLDSLVMRYVPALRGVMLCHSNAKFLSQTAVLKNECPFSICTVSFDATVWSPQIGMKLTGRINLCSPDHISLLVHRTFNVSIPREHIPTDNWAFEYGPAENDPEFGPHAVGTEETEHLEEGGRDIDGNIPAEAESGETEEPRGVWVHKITGDRLGGKEGLLEFTVIGLTVANQMLSLKGSIQLDPFSPDHVPQPAVSSRAQPNVERDDEEENGREEGSEGEKSLHYPDNPIEDSDEEEDPFSHLAQAKQEAVDRDAVGKKREKEEKAREKEEKKRRKREKRERKEREKALVAVDGTEELEVPTADEKPPKKKRKKTSQET